MFCFIINGKQAVRTHCFWRTIQLTPYRQPYIRFCKMGFRVLSWQAWGYNLGRWQRFSLKRNQELKTLVAVIKWWAQHPEHWTWCIVWFCSRSWVCRVSKKWSHTLTANPVPSWGNYRVYRNRLGSSAYWSLGIFSAESFLLQTHQWKAR